MADDKDNDQLSTGPGEGNAFENEADESVTLESGRPAVASAPGKIMVLLVIAGIFVAVVAKSLFFSGGGEAEPKPAKKNPEQVVDRQTLQTPAISAGELPAPPPPDPTLITNFSQGSSFGAGTTTPSLAPPPLTGTGGGGPSSVTATAPAPISLPAPRPTVNPSMVTPTPLSGPQPVISVPAPPPPPPPGISNPNLPEMRTTASPRSEDAQKRIASPMVTFTANVSESAEEDRRASSSFSGSDSNSAFANSAISANVSKDGERARVIENLQSTIIQGKIIHAVLESAINSDLPGTIRAIVSHDIYAEAGRAILIPKGSRLVGTYNAAVRRGQGRIFIIWTRVIRPDGIVVSVNSPGIDSLGRAGGAGFVDDKYFEMFSTAILTSAMGVGVAATGEVLFGDDLQTTTTTGSGGTTTTSSPTTEAMREAVETVGDVGKSIVGGTLNLQPTITIDQGTVVNVFVNQELIFPPELALTQKFIP